MKQDISSRSDVELLVNTFYEKVKKDNIIGYIFNDIAEVDWPHHLPVMYDFWESILLDNKVYFGNPVSKHVALDEKINLEKVHFQRWLDIFHATIDELFSGGKATMAKARAESIAGIMQSKIQMLRK